MNSRLQDNDRYVAIHANGKNRPLFWVLPYFVQSFVIKQLGADQPVYGLRGTKKSRSQMALTLEQLAGHYIQTIRNLQAHGPYALAGYCIAAAVAQEIARQLFAQGETVDPLILIDPPDPVKSEAHLIPDPLPFRLRFAVNRVVFHLNRTKEISAGKRMAYMLDSAGEVRKRLADRINQLVYRVYAKSGKPLPVQLQGSYDSSVQAFLNNVPKPYPGSAVLLRPAIKPKNAYDYANLRWAQLITGGLEIHEVPGDGHSMWQSPNAEKMSHKICLFLHKANTSMLVASDLFSPKVDRFE